MRLELLPLEHKVSSLFMVIYENTKIWKVGDTGKFCLLKIGLFSSRFYNKFHVFLKNLTPHMNLQERNANRGDDMSIEPNLSRGGSSYAI